MVTGTSGSCSAFKISDESWKRLRLAAALDCPIPHQAQLHLSAAWACFLGAFLIQL
jgi:hypothetical protein